MRLLHRADSLGKGGELLRFDLVQSRAEAARDAEMTRMFEFDAGARGPIATILNVMGKAALAGVEIYRSDALAGLEQRDSDVHSRSRLTRSAFFVTKDNDMGRERLANVRLHQHGYAPSTWRSVSPACNR